MKDTTTQAVIACIIDVMVDRDPEAATVLKPRLEAIQTKAKEWGWREDVEILDELIGRLKV